MPKIEKGVPIPRSPVVRNDVYSFGKMRIGDSFTVPSDIETRKRVQSAASAYKARHPGWCYVTRVEGKKLRVWRVK